MSSRALASAKNKRTAMPQVQTRASNNNARPAPNNNNARPPVANNNARPPAMINSNKQLSIPEAFAFINKKIANLEQRVFEDGFVPSDNSNNNSDASLSMSNVEHMINEKFNQLSDNVNYRLSKLEEDGGTDTNINPFREKNMSNNVERLETLYQDVINRVEPLTQSVADINLYINNLKENTSEQSTPLTETIDTIKDMVLKLQNFTLEINDQVLKMKNVSDFSPMHLFNEMNTNQILHMNDLEESDSDDNESNRNISIGDIIEHNDDDEMLHEPDDIEVIEDNNDTESDGNNTPINVEEVTNTINNIVDQVSDDTDSPVEVLADSDSPNEAELDDNNINEEQHVVSEDEKEDENTSVEVGEV